MTLAEATRAMKALIGEGELFTFEAKFTCNGDTEKLEILWYASTHRHCGYSETFPTLEAAVENARQIILDGKPAPAPVADVELGT